MNDIDVLVRASRWESEGVLSLSLAAPEGEKLPEWEPGAHVDLVLPSGAVRQYSLCGNGDDREHYRIAVLRERDGRGGSAEVHDSQLVGRTLRIRGPKNHFPLTAAPEHLLVAGGIGITPILAMARALAARGAEWRLLYGGRSRVSMAFLDEVGALPVDRVEVQPEDELGLLDLAALVSDARPGAAVYCCGPEPLIAAVESAVAARDDLTFHCERFGADPGRVEIDTSRDRPVDVRLSRLGVELRVPPDRSILAAVHEVLPDYPSNCTEGYCGSCETSVLAGTPDHRDDLLSEEERAAGDTMLICVSRALSDSLTLDI